jgi:hypothetical protein
MLTRERVAASSGLVELFRELGYPIELVEIDPQEWRRGGVVIPWNGEARLTLAARLRRFDLFHLEGRVPEEGIAQFMRSYADYNQLTKSVVLNGSSLFDLSHERTLRRLDVRDSAHAVDRLNLLACGEDLPRIFDRALDRESVGRQFFRRFRSAVEDVSASLRRSFPGEEKEAVETEALLILSRLLFLSFIQEKGWLDGQRRFLVDRLASEIARGREFFAHVLVPLFFGCLNTPLHERTLAARRLGRIPYLNGGLFEPSPFEQRNGELHLPNELMQQVIEGVFEKFDFRIEESDAAGTHVDPEMLGKVFESLMAEDERASSGSFYTPKEVVDLLTERAIGEWLGDGGIDRLERITVLDPACGSGAFLLSALGVIERHYRRLAGGEVPRDLRQRIVSRNLFGVDLKPEAVRLCELRLWLAIVAATDAPVEAVPPLPNLDRNILQGNSLLSPTDFLGDGRADVYGQWMVALHAQRDLLERYRTASHGQRPALYRIIRGNDQRLAAELLQKSIDGTERELEELTTPQRDLFGRAVAPDHEACRALQERISSCRRALEGVEEGALDFFSFDVHFAHVMAAGGFQVVVGNPPWVRNNRIEPRARRMYADRYALFRGARGSTAFHQPDLSVAFFERALALTAPGGTTALLMPAKITNAAYAAPLRRAAVRQARIVAIDDWSDDPRRRQWFAADTFPLGVVLARDGKRAPIRVTVSGETFDLPELSLGSEWALVPREAGTIIRRLRDEHPRLIEALNRKPLMGVKSGDNGSFFVTDEDIRRFRIPADALCRCVRGRDLRRWTVKESQWMLWPPRDGWRVVPAWLRRFAAEREIEPSNVRLAFVRPEHIGIKIAWKDLSRGMAAAVLPDVVNIDATAYPLVPNQTLYSIDAVSLDEAYAIAAVLNSTIIGAVAAATAERAKDAHFRYFGRTVAALPFPDCEPEWDRLVRLSRRAHRGSDVAGEIDAAVARLYGVSESELAVLRGFLARRLGAR